MKSVSDSASTTAGLLLIIPNQMANANANDTMAPCVLASLVKYLNSEQDNWDDFIDPCLLAYRSSVSRSTKQTPFFLAFGKQPTLLVEEDFPVGSEAKEVDEQTALDARIEAALSLFQLQKTAQDNIQSAQKVHKHYYDQKHAPPAYCVGDLVLLNNARRQQRKGDKLAPRWTGPHEISEIRDKGVVRLKDKKALTNVTRIKPYRQPQCSSAPISTSNPTLPCHNPDLPTASSSSSTSADPDCEIVDEVAGSETIYSLQPSWCWLAEGMCSSLFTTSAQQAPGTAFFYYSHNSSSTRDGVHER